MVGEELVLYCQMRGSTWVLLLEFTPSGLWMETGAKSGCDTAQQSQKLHIANPNLFCRGALQSALTWLTDPAAASKQLVEQQVLAVVH